MQSKSDPKIHFGYRPGVFGAIISMNADHYIRQCGFDNQLESTMSADLAHYWQRFNPEFDEIIYLQDNGPIVGGLLLEGVERDPSKPILEQSVKIVWFVIGNSMRGQGLGRQMILAAINKGKQMGFGKIQLGTDEFATAAIQLYESVGFLRKGETPGTLFGKHTLRYWYEMGL